MNDNSKKVAAFENEQERSLLVRIWARARRGRLPRLRFGD